MRTLQWLDGRLRLLDQTRLPGEEVYLDLQSYSDLASAIKELKVRGAPAIGVAAAYGVVLGAAKIRARTKGDFVVQLEVVLQTLASTRPTAVNLFWALDRMRRVAEKSKLSEVRDALLAEAQRLEAEDVQANHRLGEAGAELIEDGFTVLTHCNAGALATVEHGTALGVLRSAREKGKQVQVYASETRPLLQGARLTAWELIRDGFPVTLITDNMAGHFLSRGAIDCVIVGADRVAANGDVANKIGTYSLAVLAMENGVPFYVAAPTSTIDLSLPSGAHIPIEERAPDEVTQFRGVTVAPVGVKVANPAFDVTPHQYISAIITEKGVVREPYGDRLKKLMEEA